MIHGRVLVIVVVPEKDWMFRRLVVSVLFGLFALPAQAGEFRLEYVGASDVALDNPHDLKLSPDGTALFVADVGNDRVAILDPESLALISAFGADHQDGTHDVDFDAQGRAYVADTHNGRVTIYDLEGGNPVLIGELGERIRGPEGVLAHPNGRIYVAGAWSDNVVVYEDGRIVAELGGLSSPHDVELAPGGDIWLADAGNDRMLLLSPELEIKRELAGPPYDFDGVRYQDVLADGTLIAADKNNHQVKVIGPHGALLLVLGSGELRTPEGVEALGDTLWISDSGNDRVVKYRIHRD
jgi:DNA-binding beta-propeller fold protein YncE